MNTISWPRFDSSFKVLLVMSAPLPVVVLKDESINQLDLISTKEGFQRTSHFSSVQFSRSVVSDSLRPHKSQQARPPFPSRTPRVYSTSCPSSRWCHPAISSSVVPFSSCPQSLPASGSFPMSQHFPWGGESIAVSASTSVLPMNTQDLSALGRTGWISFQSKGLSRVFSNTTVQTYQFSGTQLSSQSILPSIYDHWKNQNLE